MIGARDRIALFHWQGLGDHVLAWPAIRAITRAFPGQLVLLEGPGQQFTLYQDLDELERRDFVLSDPVERDVDVAASLAQVGRCDVFLSLSFWVNPTLLALAQGMGARRVIGRLWPFPEHVACDEPGQHMFDGYFALVRHLLPAAKLDDHVQPPSYSAAAGEAARAWAAELRAGGRKLLFVHPETRTDKTWTPAGLSAALRLFLSAHPEYHALVITARPYPLELDDLAGRVSAAEPHLELALALLNEADLFLGVDSVFKHAADLAHKPGVALFGPQTDPGLWGFRLAPRSRVVSADPLSSLSPERVAAALEQLARPELPA